MVAPFAIWAAKTFIMNFLNTLKSRSKHNFNTSLNSSDTIITLSTCYSDNVRTVVHAKKIKKSIR